MTCYEGTIKNDLAQHLRNLGMSPALVTEWTDLVASELHTPALESAFSRAGATRLLTAASHLIQRRMVQNPNGFQHLLRTMPHNQDPNTAIAIITRAEQGDGVSAEERQHAHDTMRRIAQLAHAERVATMSEALALAMQVLQVNADPFLIQRLQ